MSFKNKFKMTSIALASAMAMGAMTMPTVASADVSYNAAVGSMYLWRGLDASKGPTISGGINYSHDSGAYAGAWASSGLNGTGASTSAADGYELDLFVGYSGKVSGFGYDISYWDIDYPQVTGANGKSINELSLGLTYADFSVSYTKNTKSGSKYQYITAGYTFGKFGIKYGMSDNGSDDYSHIDLSFAASDKVSFTASKLSDASGGTANPEEMLIAVTYSLPI